MYEGSQRGRGRESEEEAVEAGRRGDMSTLHEITRRLSGRF